MVVAVDRWRCGPAVWKVLEGHTPGRVETTARRSHGPEERRQRLDAKLSPVTRLAIVACQHAGEFKPRLRAATLPEQYHVLPNPFRELCSPSTPGEIAPEAPRASHAAVWWEPL